MAAPPGAATARVRDADRWIAGTTAGDDGV
jgi:hypothetical protein